MEEAREEESGTAEESLNEKFESIRLDFRTKIEKVRVLNERRLSDINDNHMKQKDAFMKKQENDLALFKRSQEEERNEFYEKQMKEVEEATDDAAKQIEAVQKAVQLIRSPFRVGDRELCNQTRQSALAAKIRYLVKNVILF